MFFQISIFLMLTKITLSENSELGISCLSHQEPLIDYTMRVTHVNCSIGCLKEYVYSYDDYLNHQPCVDRLICFGSKWNTKTKSYKRGCIKSIGEDCKNNENFCCYDSFCNSANNHNFNYLFFVLIANFLF
ncbi:unnamed protein product [Brachionus calyciflorus]|uniref:Uncharacterized protein n=1 Tax=Brachionus calyciflorus TaxID=104777 RepID=A0A814LX56_9BILA|nr:unnamed protein product [Brachionus calyciflorus]